MPLHHAAFSGSLETFCTLYSRAERSAVAAVDNRGSTPLSLLSRRALVLLSNAASTALALAEKSKVLGQKVPEYSQHIDQGAEVRQLNEYLTALMHRQKLMSSGLQHLMHALEAETERRSLEISLRDEGLGWGGDTATSGLPSLVGTDWAQAAADITSPLEYKLLVELANPETVNASELIVELARVKRSLTFERSVRSMLECQDRGAILRRRGVLSFEACNTLKRELDRRASLRAGTTDGMPEFTLHLNRAELQQLIGEDATTILWQLPSTYIAESAAHRQSSELSNAGEKAERRSQIGGDAFAQNGLSFTEIEIFLRKFSAKTRPWIKLHADVATVTVNVALGTEDGSSSGGLLGVFGGKVHTIPRAIGEATVHPSTLVHGVSRMLESADTRYTLIIFFKQNVSAQE
uniref:Uncharacterized protein n=1 Tax=Chrysotila carterae TaxID=13221 RepID=A0A7S4ETK5_CHRCT